MKNMIVALLVSFIVLPAFAAGTGDTGSVGKPSQAQINKKALEILLSKSKELTVAGDVGEEEKTLSDVLAADLVSSGKRHNKIRNSCRFDESDKIFKCELFILNRDDSGFTESSTSIRYELEKAPNGYPSENLFMLSVEVSRAG